jgi:uncharacterized protein (DUF983 family)
MLNGWHCTCPACGEGKLYTAYLKTADSCPACGESLHHHRADDLPPYITITIVGHIIVPLLLIVEKTWHPALWIHALIWLPLTLGLTLWFLPRVKGAVVGLQWANRMHGFSDNPEIEPSP